MNELLGAHQQIPTHITYQSFLPAVDNSYDLGSSTNRFKDLYLSEYAILDNASAYIQNSTVDGADTAHLTLTASGHAQISLPLAADYLGFRGSFISMSGDQAVDNSGDLRLESGSAAASSVLVYLNSSGTGSFNICKHTAALATDTVFWSVSNSGTLTPGADNTYNFGASSTRPSHLYTRLLNINANLTFDKAGDNDITTDTADAADSSSVRLTGGGAYTGSGTRGGAIGLYGNEHGNTGQILLTGGNVAAGHIVLTTNNAAALIKNQLNGSDSWTFNTGFSTFVPSSNNYDFRSSSNTNSLNICGGTSSAAGNGAVISVCGNTIGGGSNGGVFIDGGNVSGQSVIQLRLNNASAQFTLKGSSNTQVLAISNAGVIITASGNESTGAGTALLGANSPAVTNTAPYKWIKFTTSDASVVYIPCWK